MKRPPFSSRTRWDLRPNLLSTAVESRKRRGQSYLDLTESNPSRCGLSSGEEILRALSRPEALRYDPDPRGMPAARRAVAALYAGLGIEIDPDRIVLTSGTSEGYGHLFRLLADPGGSVLVPSPSYPLFDFLARIHDVILKPYPLIEEDGFRVDLEALERSVGEGARAVLVVNPGNPTGTFLARAEHEALAEICAERGLALISDEVFGDYAFSEDRGRASTVAGGGRALTFVLNGISKMLALPQMKLGWIAASGPSDVVDEALGRLEVIADTYLSVGAQVQAALPELLSMRKTIQPRISARLSSNRRTLAEILAPPGAARVLPAQGGWSAVIRVPATRSDEAWALALLEEDGVLVHPGFFFDFPREGRLVVSLLPEEGVFREGISRLAARFEG